MKWSQTFYKAYISISIVRHLAFITAVKASVEGRVLYKLPTYHIDDTWYNIKNNGFEDKINGECFPLAFNECHTNCPAVEVFFGYVDTTCSIKHV